jgi:hypothetical protein
MGKETATFSAWTDGCQENDRKTGPRLKSTDFPGDLTRIPVRLARNGEVEFGLFTLSPVIAGRRGSPSAGFVDGWWFGANGMQGRQPRRRVHRTNPV